MHLAAHKPQAGPGSEKPEVRTEYPLEVRLDMSELRCKVCDKYMKHKHDLIRHMKVHNNSIKLNVYKLETLN